MKRLFAIVFLLLFVSCFSSSIADGYDFTQMSDEELIELRDAIDNELMDRISSEALYLRPGTYVIGDDLDPGRYAFRGVRLAKKWSSGAVQLFYSAEDEKPYEFCVMRLDDECSMKLEEGRVLKIQAITCTAKLQ